MTVDEIQEKQSAFERHAQTALVLLLVALLLWVGSTTQATAITVSAMRVEVAYLKAAAMQPQPAYQELTKRLDNLTSRVEHVERENDKK